MTDKIRTMAKVCADEVRYECYDSDCDSEFRVLSAASIIESTLREALAEKDAEIGELVKAVKQIVDSSWIAYYDGGSVGECVFCHKADFGEHRPDCEWLLLKTAFAKHSTPAAKEEPVKVETSSVTPWKSPGYGSGEGR